MKKKVLITVHTNTFYIELFRFAETILGSTNYLPIISFGYYYPTVKNDIVKCNEKGIMALAANGESIDLSLLSGKQLDEFILPSPERQSSQILKLFIQPVRRKFFQLIYHPKNQNPITRIIQQIDYFRDRNATISRLLDNQAPSIMVLGGDMVEYDTAIYIKLAHKRKIPVLIIPSTMSNGLEQAEAYFHNPDNNLDRWFNRLISRIFPKWLFFHRDRKLLRIQGERVLLFELLGISPPRPWSFNSGFADAIAIESNRMKEYYLECGLPQEQLRVTGSLADDVMVDILRERKQNISVLNKSLGIKNNKPLLLSALPPNFLYLAGGRPECDFQDYPSLVKFWVQTLLNATNYNIIVCLHPSDKYEDFKYIEDWGVKIAQQNTASLIPLADIYVASVSSTIRWAIACGIPVINYDVYRYRYTDYLGLEGVLNIENQSDYQKSISRLTSEPAFYQTLKKAQVSVAKNWGLFDGCVSKRIISLLDELSNSRI